MKKYLLVVVLLVLIVSSCSKKDKYEQWVEHELASGVRQDSLFLGIGFGMTSKKFFAHCWELNKQGVIRQGLGKASVEYRLDDELKYPATMNFYPNFSENTIYEMPVRFKYEAWAPWNKPLQADSLQLDVLEPDARLVRRAIYGCNASYSRNSLHKSRRQPPD